MGAKYEDMPGHVKRAIDAYRAKRGLSERVRLPRTGKQIDEARVLGADVVTTKPPAWSAAKRVTSHGIIWDSKLEGVVYARLLADLAPGQRLAIKQGFQLLAMGTGPNGRALHRFTPDFTIWEGGVIARVVEAKGRTTSDYTLRRDAFSAEYGVAVQEVRE